MKLISLSCLLLVTFGSCHKSGPTAGDTGNQDPNLVAYYPFDGSTNDMSGNAINGQGHNLTPAKDRFGMAGKAYAFNGDSSSASFADSPILDSLTNELTICFWIKIVPFPSPGYYAYTIISKRDYTKPDYTIHFHVALDVNNLLFYPQPGPDSYERYVPTQNIYAVLADSQWHFVAIRHKYNDSSNTAIFVDGVVRPGSWVATSTVYVGPAQVGSSYLMMGKQNILGGEYYFKGALDDIRLYKKLLSNAEILALFNGS